MPKGKPKKTNPSLYHGSTGGRKPHGPEGAPSTVPPSLAEDPDKLRQEAASVSSDAGSGAGPGDSTAPQAPGMGKRGRKAKAEEIAFPVEALAMLHREVWLMIAKGLRSQFILSEEGAAEMAKFADLCLRQYAGPLLSEHAALAAYVMTQLTALGAVLVLRVPKEPTARIAPAPSAPRGGDVPDTFGKDLKGAAVPG